MNATALSELNGRNVLVCSAQDHRNPPAGLRGTVLVHESEQGAQPVVEVELDFPQMFTTPAHVRRVVLTESEVGEMLRSERGGTFTVTLPDRLDPLGPLGPE